MQQPRPNFDVQLASGLQLTELLAYNSLGQHQQCKASPVQVYQIVHQTRVLRRREYQ